MKEEEEFPDVDEVALITQSRGRRSAIMLVIPPILENARSNANIDVETAWKLMDSRELKRRKRKEWKRANRKKKVALEEARKKMNNRLVVANTKHIVDRSRQTTENCVRVSTDYTYNNNNNNNALGVLQSVPSFLRYFR